MFVLSGKDGIARATKRYECEQVEKKNKKTEALRPPTAFQIGGIGEGDHLSSICTLSNESMDVLLAWEKRREGENRRCKTRAV